MALMDNKFRFGDDKAVSIASSSAKFIVGSYLDLGSNLLDFRGSTIYDDIFKGANKYLNAFVTSTLLKGGGANQTVQFKLVNYSSASATASTLDSSGIILWASRAFLIKNTSSSALAIGSAIVRNAGIEAERITKRYIFLIGIAGGTATLASGKVTAWIGPPTETGRT